MKYAIIDSENIVENIVIADSEFAEERGWVELPEDERVGIGWIFDGTNFIDTSDPEAELAELAAKSAENIRSKRNDLLDQSDWTQLVDSPLSSEEKSAWALYRQELRNVPEQETFPRTVEWPLSPLDEEEEVVSPGDSTVNS